MSEPAPTDKPFPWKPIGAKLVFMFGVVATVITILVFFAPNSATLLVQNWWVGWVVSAALGVLCIVAIEVFPWKRNKGISDQVDRIVDERVSGLRPELEEQAIETLQLKVREDGIQSRADRATIQKLWGSFRVDQRFYEELYHWPHDKYFTVKLFDAFEDLKSRLDRLDWGIYDPDVAKDVEEARKAMHAYWGPLSKVLDGSEGNYDLAVIQPPNGTWGRVEVSEGHWEPNPGVDPWVEFYTFVNGLSGYRQAFLRSMEKLGAREKELGVRSRVGASLSGSGS